MFCFINNLYKIILTSIYSNNMVLCMVKILMTTHTTIPYKRLDQEAKTLKDAGHEIYLICGSQKKNLPPPDFYEKIYYIPLNKRTQSFLPFATRKAAKQYAKVIAAIQPDVIHAHDLMAANVSRLTIPKNTKFVYDDWEVWELYRKYDFLSKKNIIKKLIRLMQYFTTKWANKKVIKKIDFMIVVNDYWKTHYEKRGAKNNQIITLENFPSKKIIEQSLGKDELVDSFILNDTRKKIIHSSASSKVSEDFQRDITNIVQAVSELDDWAVIIFSKPDEKFENLGVKFLQPRSLIEFLACCSRCDIALNPLILNERTHYSSPNRLFEFAVLGLKIMSSKAKTFVDKFDDSLIWVDPATPKEDIKDILIHLERYASGEEMKKLAKDFFWEKEAMKLIEKYNEMLGKN